MGIDQVGLDGFWLVVPHEAGPAPERLPVVGLLALDPLGHRRPQPDLPHWLREVGLIELRQKPTLIIRSQPLRPVEKKFVGALLEYYAGQAEQAALPAEELDLWRKLTELDAGDHIIHHPDFQYRCIQTVFVGRVP